MQSPTGWSPRHQLRGLRITRRGCGRCIVETMLTPVQRLKLALFTDGVVVTPEARRQISGEGKHGRPLTLADYASTSGISMELDGRIWVNAPIQDFNPNFVQAPPHRLDFEDGEFWIRSDDLRVRAQPVPV